jgi:hypothetical protein
MTKREMLSSRSNFASRVRIGPLRFWLASWGRIRKLISIIYSVRTSKKTALNRIRVV